MNSTKDKIKGQANVAVGNVKDAVGKFADSDKMKIQGEVQKLKGEAQKASGNIKDTINQGFKKMGQAAKDLGKHS